LRVAPLAVHLEPAHPHWVAGFGWYIKSVDSQSGGALLSIRNYSAAPSAVPVPAALPLMASALVAFGISRRSKVKLN
jgi:hypothetical protein